MTPWDSIWHAFSVAVIAAAFFCFIVVATRNIISMIQLLIAAWVFATRIKPGEGAREMWRRYSDLALPITVLAPAYNEELTIIQSVKALLALQYPEHEVYVINDGSTDKTLETLITAFDMERTTRTPVAHLQKTKINGIYRSRKYPNLTVIDKQNGRKADAVNAGLSYALTPLVCIIDADSIIEPDGLLRAAEPFFYDNGKMVAVGGTIRVANGSTVKAGSLQQIGVAKEFVPRVQIVEYLRAFLMARVASARTNTLLLISGAFGLFRRSTLVEVGGLRHDTVGEDLEIMVRLHRHMRETGQPYDMEFVPDIVCWTEAPHELDSLSNQRARWQQGALETLVRHRRMIGNPRYGRIGLLAIPHVVLEDVIGPPAELIGYLVIPAGALLGILDPMMALAFLFVSVVFGCALSIGTLVLEEKQLRRTQNSRDLVRLGVAAILENFGYRQLNLWYRLRGIRRFMKKDGTWAAVTRRGFDQPV